MRVTCHKCRKSYEDPMKPGPAMTQCEACFESTDPERLRARITELEAALVRATHCDCGRRLMYAACGICDNDE